MGLPIDKYYIVSLSRDLLRNFFCGPSKVGHFGAQVSIQMYGKYTKNLLCSRNETYFTLLKGTVNKMIQTQNYTSFQLILSSPLFAAIVTLHKVVHQNSGKRTFTINDVIFITQ